METRVAVLSIIVENEATVSESLLSDGWASPTGRKT